MRNAAQLVSTLETVAQLLSALLGFGTHFTSFTGTKVLHETRVDSSDSRAQLLSALYFAFCTQVTGFTGTKVLHETRVDSSDSCAQLLSALY